MNPIFMGNSKVLMLNIQILKNLQNKKGKRNVSVQQSSKIR